MKSVKRFARMMALAVAVCMLLAIGVFAAENGNVWVSVSSEEGRTTAIVKADCTVTDGNITVTYDADALTYRGIEVNEDYVAMHSVNAEEAGVVRFAWVAPGEVEIDGEGGIVLISFSGESDEEPVLDGTVTDAEIVDEPAQGEEPTEPEEGEDPTEPEQGEEPTEAPAEDGEDATQAPTKPSGNKKPGSNRPGTGDNTNITLLVVLSLVCVAGIAAVAAVMLKVKKEGKA